MPFTQQEFMQVFARYNQAIWPAQVVMYALALAALVLIPRKTGLSDRFAGLTLAIMWALAGAGYHIGFFSAINPVARVFGALFLLQAALLLVTSIRGRGTQFDYGHGAWIGWILVAYAMVLYPALGSLLGHRYPEAPMFGVAPCPIVIFTFGLLLWTNGSCPRYLLIIPAIWSLIGLSAAVQLHVYQDFGLVISGLIAVPILLRRRPKRLAEPTEPAETAELGKV